MKERERERKRKQNKRDLYKKKGKDKQNPHFLFSSLMATEKLTRLTEDLVVVVSNNFRTNYEIDHCSMDIDDDDDDDNRSKTCKHCKLMDRKLMMDSSRFLRDLCRLELNRRATKM